MDTAIVALLPENTLKTYVKLQYDCDYDGSTVIVLDTLRNSKDKLYTRMFFNIKDTQKFLGTRVLITYLFDPILAGFFSLDSCVPANLPIYIFHSRYILVRATHSHIANTEAVSYVYLHSNRATHIHSTIKTIDHNSVLGQIDHGNEHLVLGTTRRKTTNIAGKDVARYRPR